MVQKIRTKGLLEALQWTRGNHREMYDFLTHNKHKDEYMKTEGEHFLINHSVVEGGLVVKDYDDQEIPVHKNEWVIKGSDGNFFVVDQKYFEAHYEKVEG